MRKVTRQGEEPNIRMLDWREEDAEQKRLDIEIMTHQLDTRLQELEEQERQLVSRTMEMNVEQTRLEMKKWELDKMMLELERQQQRMSSGNEPAELDVISTEIITDIAEASWDDITSYHN